MDLDEFSDDGLDDLPDKALQELENNAISFTQAQHAARKPQQPSQGTQHAFSDYGWDEDDDLDTSEVINGAGAPVGRPSGTNVVRQQQPPQSKPSPQRPKQPLLNPTWNHTIDPLNRPNEGFAPRPNIANPRVPHQPVVASQRAQSHQPPTLNRPQSNQFVKPALPPNRVVSSQPYSSQQQNYPKDVVSALQQRVRALEADLNVARGEVSILRTNSTKASQQHTEEVARLKKLNTEKIERQERILEAAVAAEKNASVELQFLQQDMRDASKTTRPKRRDTAAAGAHSQGENATTPKKGSKSWGMADGFDDMEISSPSKGQGRGKNTGSVAANVGERTPSKGKRKRPVVDSPVMALETHTSDIVMLEKAPAHQAPPVVGAPSAPAPPFEFLQLALDHAAFHDKPPTFDKLSRLALPSEPDTSLSTLIFQRLPMMGNPHRPMQLLVDFVEQLLALWIRCCDESYWEPIKYLSSLICFTFHLNTTSIAPLVRNNLVFATETTIRTLTELRHRLPEGDLEQNEEYDFLEAHIDTSQILSLLYSCALASLVSIPEDHRETPIQELWRIISLDMVMLLLTPKQKPEDIIAMLDLLATSSLSDSLGPIGNATESAVVAKHVIERVSAKLTEAPRCTVTADQKRRIRIAALRALVSFSSYPWGALQVASHNNALPRLVTCLSSAIDELYDQTIPPNILPQPDDAESEPRSPSTDLYNIISQCVTLIHFLVTSTHTANAADINQKLSVSYGGSQRYLIALGRLTFAEEDLVIEAGIESEVVEAAHELLEMAVTPDEGEIVSEAFGA